MSKPSPTPATNITTFKTSLQQYTYSDTLPPPRVTRASLSASTPHSASPNSQKRKRPSSTFAPPTKYAHIPNLLTDSLRPNLICLFIGLNPGLRTATTGHAYAHPSNLFWKLLHSSNCTPRLCKPSEDRDLPHLYALGNTNIVGRATKDGSELSKEEMDAGVAGLEEKCRRWRPEAVCLVGKGIWESVWRVRHGRAMRKEEFSYGWQGEGERMGVIKGEGGDGGWGGSRVFVATSTSGLAAGMSLREKKEVWRELGEWAARRRGERGIPDEGGVGVEPDLVKEEEDEKAMCPYDLETF